MSNLEPSTLNCLFSRSNKRFAPFLFEGSIPGASTIKGLETSHFRNDLQDFTQELEGVSEDLRARNRRRKRRLVSFKEASPRAARPGSALVRGLDAAYAGDLEQVEKELLKCCQALGGGR
jgi:hypothetical protein